MMRFIPFVILGLAGWSVGLFGNSGRSRSLSKARAAKKKYSQMRKGRKMSLKDIRLRSLAKARRVKAMKRKKK